LAHCSDHLIVPVMTDQHDVIPLPSILNGFQMHLRHERTCRIYRLQFPTAGLSSNLRRHPVGRIQEQRSFGNFAQLINERDPLPAEPIHHIPVMNDLMIYVDVRPESANDFVETIDRHIHPRAKTARVCKENLHAARQSLNVEKLLNFRDSAPSPPRAALRLKWRGVSAFAPHVAGPIACSLFVMAYSGQPLKSRPLWAT